MKRLSCGTFYNEFNKKSLNLSQEQVKFGGREVEPDALTGYPLENCSLPGFEVRV